MDAPPFTKPGIDALDAAYAAAHAAERPGLRQRIESLFDRDLVPLVQAWHAYPERRGAIEAEFGDAVDTLLLARRAYPCHDCTYPTAPNAAGRQGPREYYMVCDDIWTAATAGRAAQFLCIGCLEIRIGRTLTRADFTDWPVNTAPDWRTPRLDERLGRRKAVCA